MSGGTMSSLSALATPLADWHGTGGCIVFVPFCWLAVALLFFALFRRRGWGPGCGGAEQILDRRFAAGEIDAEEYRGRREALRRGEAPSGVIRAAFRPAMRNSLVQGTGCLPFAAYVF